MKRTWQDYELREAVNFSKSLSDVCRYLNLVPMGGNINSMKRAIARLGLDVTHFTGQGWNKNNYSKPRVGRKHLRKRLIFTRGHRCERCNLTLWQEVPIPLEVDHIDGDNTNDNDDNLIMLCCNCHALTPTWRNRKRRENYGPVSDN